MFESRLGATLDPATPDPERIEDEPLPGDEGYESFAVYQGQQDAFWSAVGLGEIPVVGGRPDLTGSRTDAGLLAAAQRAERREARALGEKLQSIADHAFRKIAVPEVGYDEDAMLRSVECEVAFAFRLSKAEAFDLLDLAMTLTRRLPRTFTALQDGEIGLRKVRAIADETANLNVTQCAQLEARVLPEAAARTTRSLREKVRREVEKLDADAIRKRREAAIADRALYVKDEPDGMATLCLYLPAEAARAICDTINSRIPAHRTDPDDDRKIAARRLDYLTDVLAAALGIDPTTLTATVADAHSPALTTEQIARLDRNANSYVPTPAMKAAIRARDTHCRAPGCRRPAVHCDIDHTVAFNLAVKSGGRTIYTNLGCFCRFHHQVKQFPGWHVTQDQHANFTWTDPTGRTFTTRPPPPDGEEPPEFWAPEEDPAPFPF